MSAMPIGMPGWPELAACTASIDSARMALASSRRLDMIVPDWIADRSAPRVHFRRFNSECREKKGRVLRASRFKHALVSLLRQRLHDQIAIQVARSATRAAVGQRERRTSRRETADVVDRAVLYEGGTAAHQSLRIAYGLSARASGAGT